MAGPLYLGNCNYTPISTVGTGTIAQGATPADPGSVGRFGVLYGAAWVATGTSFGITLYDVIVQATGTGTTTTTNTLMNGTGTAGQNIPAGISGVGVRYRGSLVYVTTGTAGALNALWD